jgi:hypothetical protein
VVFRPTLSKNIYEMAHVLCTSKVIRWNIATKFKLSIIFVKAEQACTSAHVPILQAQQVKIGTVDLENSTFGFARTLLNRLIRFIRTYLIDGVPRQALLIELLDPARMCHG